MDHGFFPRTRNHSWFKGETSISIYFKTRLYTYMSRLNQLFEYTNFVGTINFTWPYRGDIFETDKRFDEKVGGTEGEHTWRRDQRN